ncbi:Adenylosuccinate lyase [human gut metagenome]|uniref:Adenylosuccinate lyase n=1 Tax=human gut metagenome TaxID=408170 RepID=W1Y6R0_9ZZZZ
MIERYSREEMSSIWTDQNRYEAWLEVEILASEAWSELGYIPKEDVQKIRQNARAAVAGCHWYAFYVWLSGDWPDADWCQPAAAENLSAA